MYVGGKKSAAVDVQKWSLNNAISGGIVLACYFAKSVKRLGKESSKIIGSDCIFAILSGQTHFHGVRKWPLLFKQARLCTPLFCFRLERPCPRVIQNRSLCIMTRSKAKVFIRFESSSVCVTVRCKKSAVVGVQKWGLNNAISGGIFLIGQKCGEFGKRISPK